jgi:hypothetical protein
MRCATALLFVAVAYAPARAQGACTGCDSTRSHVFGMVGLRAGTPQKLSGALGIVVGREWQKYGADRSRDIALFVEPGLGAGRASAAFIKGIGSMGSGYGIAATVLRTWKQPWSLTANTTVRRRRSAHHAALSHRPAHWADAPRHGTFQGFVVPRWRFRRRSVTSLA